MINSERIKKNYKKWFDTCSKGQFTTEELLNLLGTKIITAPLNTHTDMGGAYEGGLIQYLLQTASFAVGINESLPDDMKLDQNSVIKVSLLHAIGRYDMFTPCTSDWHREKQGKMYEYVNLNTSMLSSDRTLYVLSQTNVKLTEEEYNAILSYDKDNDMIKFHSPLLTYVLKSAIDLVRYKMVNKVNK